MQDNRGSCKRIKEQLCYEFMGLSYEEMSVVDLADVHLCSHEINLVMTILHCTQL